MKNKLLIVGASGHGKVCAEIAKKMKKWDKIAFLDDNSELDEVLGLDVIGKSIDVNQYVDQYDIFIGIGNNDIRKKIYKKISEASIPILIHPSAIIGENVSIGKGTVIIAGVVVNTSAEIGECCIINTSSTIGHDVKVLDFTHIAPGVNVAGHTIIGKNCWIGIGTSVIQNINICDDCFIGAGAVVVKNIGISGVYAGIPAKKIRD